MSAPGAARLVVVLLLGLVLFPDFFGVADFAYVGVTGIDVDDVGVVGVCLVGVGGADVCLVGVGGV